MLQYRPYYKMLQRKRFPVDPKVLHRALAIGALSFIVSLAIIVYPTTVFIGTLADMPVMERIMPFSMVFWTLNHALNSAERPDLGELLLKGWLLIGIAGFCSFVFCFSIFLKQMRNENGLTNEEGDGGWITPEDMAETGLLPPDYDIKRGFRAGERELIRIRERDRALRADRERSAHDTAS